VPVHRLQSQAQSLGLRGYSRFDVEMKCLRMYQFTVNSLSKLKKQQRDGNLSRCVWQAAVSALLQRVSAYWEYCSRAVSFLRADSFGNSAACAGRSFML